MNNTNFVKLGSSGLSISPLIVGCMSFGSKNFGEWVIDDEEKIMKILKKCYDGGLRTFDTADVYSNGKSELLLGSFIKKYKIPRERIVILTKVFFPVDNNDSNFSVGKLSKEYDPIDYVNSKGLSRKHLFDAVEYSVKRLGTYIDVLQIHRLDDDTPKTEIMKALNDIVEAGHTRYIGASTMRAIEFAQLQYIAEKHGWTKFISMQNYYNLLYREEEREMIPFCNNNELGQIGIIPYSPIARGLLARPLDSGKSIRANTDSLIKIRELDKFSDADRTTINRVQVLAEKKNVSMAVVATKWCMKKGTTPIVGINSENRVDDILNVFSCDLTEDELKYLEEPYIPKKVIN